jgi:hypothetical protein
VCWGRRIFVLLYQYLYLCTSKASIFFFTWGAVKDNTPSLRQYVYQYFYFCTSKAIFFFTWGAVKDNTHVCVEVALQLLLQRQYSYFCTKKASKSSSKVSYICVCRGSTAAPPSASVFVLLYLYSICTFVPVIVL